MSKYKIFPDYTSTGVWKIYEKDDAEYYSTFGNHVSADLPDYVPDSIKIALKYWHEIWEFFISDEREHPVSQGYINQWHEDGQKLVDELNLLSNDVYIYEE